MRGSRSCARRISTWPAFASGSTPSPRRSEAAGAEGTAVLFFAGHAVQLNGTNYLLPVDAS